MSNEKENKEEVKLGRFWAWMLFVILAILFLILKQYKFSIECFIIALGTWGMEFMYRIIIREIGSKRAKGALTGLFTLGLVFLVLSLNYIVPPILGLFK